MSSVLPYIIHVVNCFSLSIGLPVLLPCLTPFALHFCPNFHVQDRFSFFMGFFVSLSSFARVFLYFHPNFYVVIFFNLSKGSIAVFLSCFAVVVLQISPNFLVINCLFFRSIARFAVIFCRRFFSFLPPYSCRNYFNLSIVLLVRLLCFAVVSFLFCPFFHVTDCLNFAVMVCFYFSSVLP